MLQALGKNRILIAAALALALAGLPAHSQDPSADPGRQKDEIAQTADPCLSRPNQSINGHGYKFCGLHWRLSMLPIKLQLNHTGLPRGISQEAFMEAAKMAAKAWDLFAPAKGTRSWPSDPECNGASVVCIDETFSPANVPADDEKNIIRFGGLGPSAAPGFADVIYDTATGRLRDVDITLNSSRSWYVDGLYLVAGLASGAVAFACNCTDLLDLQTLLTHEIGHALGLHHVNPGSGQVWPSEAADAPDYNIVMYERYYPGNSTQRVLQWGDIAGIQAAVSKSQSDP